MEISKFFLKFAAEIIVIIKIKTMDIKGLIKKQGMTLDQVAEKMGVSTSSVSQTTKGNPTVEMIGKIAEAIGVKRWQMFADEMTYEDVRRMFAYEIEQEIKESTLIEQTVPSQQNKRVGEASRQAIVCPHCGEPIAISVAISPRSAT